MTEKAVQQIGVVTEPAETAGGDVVQLSDRSGHCVEQVALDPPVAQLLRVHVRRVGRQPFDLVIVRMGSQEVLHQSGTMGFQAVPEHQQRSAELAPEVAQCGDDLLVMDAAAEVAGVQPRRPVQWRLEGDTTGDFASLAQPAEDRRPTNRRPGGAEAGPKGMPRLIQEGYGASCSASPFLMRGQSRVSQASTTASSRSRARAMGRCGLQRCARSARHRERK